MGMFRAMSSSGRTEGNDSQEQPSSGAQRPPNPKKGSFLRFLPSKEKFSMSSISSADLGAARGSLPPSGSTSSASLRGLMAQAASLGMRGSSGSMKRGSSGAASLPPSASTGGRDGATNADGEFTSYDEGDLPEPPEEFICPLSLEMMYDPVIVDSGQTYERAFIERWIADGNGTCPKTRQPLTLSAIFPNQVLCCASAGAGAGGLLLPQQAN